MNLFYIFASLFVVFWTWFSLVRPRKGVRIPPGPYPIPILGNILQLGLLPHKSLAKLAQTYGPILSLRLGSMYTVVITSPELAKEILQKHDQVCSGRMVPIAGEAHDHHKFCVGLLPVGPEWRKLRKLSHEHLFSMARLEAGRGYRQKQVERLREYVQKCCDNGTSVRIGEATLTTVLNLISATLFSEELTDLESGGAAELRITFRSLIRCMGSPNVADFFPFFKPFDPLGILKETEFHSGKMLALTEDLINKRLRLRKEHPDSPKKADFLEILLDFEQTSEYGLDVNEIKHFFMDLLVAGSDTTSTTIEWAMTELLMNPRVLAKVRDEHRSVFGDDHKLFEESDFVKLPYFQAVIKEVLRCHPAGPLLIPHKVERDIEVNGYTIPKDTQVIINEWAITRDPSRWSDPDSFEPERFLENKLDFRGQSFEYFPFGGGRRICPGLTLATRIANMTIATLIHNFDWQLESTREVEIAEKFGVSLHKAVPLQAVPIKLSGA